MDIQFVDYDNVRFHLSTPNSKSSITLSMGIQCWPDLVKYGARQHLEQEFGAYLVAEGETEPEYDVSLVIDLEQLPAEAGTSSHYHIRFSPCHARSALLSSDRPSHQGIWAYTDMQTKRAPSSLSSHTSNLSPCPPLSFRLSKNRNPCRPTTRSPRELSRWIFSSRSRKAT